MRNMLKIPEEKHSGLDLWPTLTVKREFMIVGILLWSTKENTALTIYDDDEYNDITTSLFTLAVTSKPDE